MKPQRSGPLPTLESATEGLIVPDQAAPVYQAEMVRMIRRLIECLNQVDNRSPGHTYRYNAKVDAKAFLVRGPDGTHWALHRDHLTACTTLTDLQALARRTVRTLKDEAEAVMEEQDKSRLYDTIRRATVGAEEPEEEIAHAVPGGERRGMDRTSPAEGPSSRVLRLRPDPRRQLPHREG